MTPLLNLTAVPPPGGSQADVADYAAQMAGALSDLCRNAQLDVLAYLLELARAEALTQAQAASRLGEVLTREG